MFARGDQDLTERLTLTLGARYTWDRNQYRDGYAYLFAYADRFLVDRRGAQHVGFVLRAD